MRHYCFYIILFLSVFKASSQTIDITINNLNQNKIQFSYLNGEDVVFIDSLLSNSDYQFHYSFDKNGCHAGIYRLSLPFNNSIDFIIDHEDIIMKTDTNNILDSMVIVKSSANKLYYAFLKKNLLYKTKIAQLRSLLLKYSTSDDEYSLNKSKLAQLQTHYLSFIKNIAPDNLKSFVARYIRAIQFQGPDFISPKEINKDSLKIQYLDNLDFKDDDLLYTDVFSSRLKKYLALFKHTEFSKDLLEKEYMTAVDSVLNKAKVNQLVYENITAYLINQFKELGYNEVIVYIVDNYVVKDDLCMDDQLKNSIQVRMDQSKRFIPGADVPNIILPDSSGKDIRLMDIKAEKILILFFASWCPHCQRLLPKLIDFYNKQNKSEFEVLAVSIDTTRNDWLNFVRKYNLNWLNVSDLKGGNGKYIHDFYLFATPAMFLVNDKKKIIAILSDLEDLKKYIK